MAIDTEQKRRAAAAMPVFPVTLKPDGTISTADRQQIGWGYPGISASTTPSVPGVEWTLPKNRAHWSLPENRLHHTLPKNRAHWSVEEEV